ncbi:MAG: tyrosine-type recombinase/integrase [Phycisphaeraceae bacterium]|nr:tyrosine-type recombinase/integrase [Phycisphaeraceae bacterium]
MASVVNDPDGRKRILVVDAAGNRRAIRLGKMSVKAAEAIRCHVEELAAATMHGQAVARQTALWASEVGDKLHAKLARAGLVKPRQAGPDVPGIRAFIEGYLAQRPDVKPATMLVMEQAAKWAWRFFGEDRKLDTVTPADADAYKAHLVGKGNARSTVMKWTRYARHFFEVARRRKLIAENPLVHLKGAVKGDPARRMFVPADDVRKVVDVATDAQWKLLIALARWGGLRTPSEPLALTWQDVDFERQRFIVRASKTEHHEDGGIRVVPMFPELADLFQTVFDEAEPGAVHVITRYRDPSANLRTQLCRYITAAGLKPWPKPWQNLRASRATELADLFPSHVCAAWLGHTEAVADAFYRQVTDDHFARAIKAAQNPAQQTSEYVRNGQMDGNRDRTKTPENPLIAVGCDDTQDREVGDTGLEPVTSTL